MVYQTLRSYNFYLDTADRSGGTIGRPLFLFPNNLFQLDTRQKIKITLQEATIFYNFYQTEITNNKFYVEESVDINGTITTFNRIVELDIGNYNLATLQIELNNKLNIPNSLYTYQITINESQNLFLFNAFPKLGDVLTTDTIIFNFNRQDVIQKTGIDIVESPNRLLGFPDNSIVSFNSNLINNSAFLFSLIPVDMSSSVANIYVRIDNNCTNYATQGTDIFSYSNTLAKIPVAQPPFSTIFYYNIEDKGNYNTIIDNTYLENLNIVLLNSRDTVITPRSDWNLTIRVEIVVEKNEINMEKTLNEMLSIMKLKMIKKDSSKKKNKNDNENTQEEIIESNNNDEK